MTTHEWIDLTDHEIESIADMVANKHFFGPVPNFRLRFAKAIETKLKEKNGQDTFKTSTADH